MHSPPDLPAPSIVGIGQRRSRVLLVLEASFAGAGRHVLDLAAGLLALGQEVHLVYSPRRMELEFGRELLALKAQGLVTVQVPMAPEPGPADLVSVWRVRRYLKRAGPFDVIHGHSSKGGAVARLAAIGLEVRRLYTPHAFKTMDPTLSAAKRSLYGTAERLLARFATERLLLVSTDEARHARTQRMPTEKLKVIPNGTRVPDDVPDRVLARARFGLREETVVLAWVGRLAPQKAPERFVALVAALRAEMPDLRALMLGYGELESRIVAQIRACDLGSILQLHTDRRGWDAMAAADLFVLTSRYEAMPYVVLEAQALGVPVVATDVSGVRDDALQAAVRVAPNSDDITALAADVRAALGERLARAGSPTHRDPIPGRNSLTMAREILEAYLPQDPDARLKHVRRRGERTVARLH